MIASRTGIRLTPSWRGDVVLVDPVALAQLTVEDQRPDVHGDEVAAAAAVHERHGREAGVVEIPRGHMYTLCEFRQAIAPAARQAGDLVGVEAELAEHRVGVDPRVRVRGRPASPRCG